MSRRTAASAPNWRAALVLSLSLLAALAPAGSGSASTAGASASERVATASASGAVLRAVIRRAKPRVRCKARNARRAGRARAIRRAKRGRAACGGPAPSGDRLTPVTPPARETLRVGLVANTQGYERYAGREQDAASETGVGWLREELDWDVIEPRDGQWRWDRYDLVFGEAARRGLRILPLLNGSASWAAPRWNQFPADLRDYAEYVAKVTERYGPGGTFWQAHPELASHAATHFELWNEPYIEYFSIDKVSPSRYARLAKAGAAAGRAANPQAKFLLSADTFYTEAPGDYRNWIDGMYAAVPDLNSYFDAVAVHPYSSSLSPDVYTPGRDGGTRWQFRRIEEMRDTFDEHGARDKGFWITELGWATCTGDDDCVTEHQQAEYVSRVFAYARGRYSGFMEAVFIYHLNDWGPADQSNKEYWFGLTRKDGTRKPAFHALRAAAAGPR
jgi:polysaccharide biosynthesis protein PslG